MISCDSDSSLARNSSPEIFPQPGLLYLLGFVAQSELYDAGRAIPLLMHLGAFICSSGGNYGPLRGSFFYEKNFERSGIMAMFEKWFLGEGKWIIQV
jgi:hypothetical protein